MNILLRGSRLQYLHSAFSNCETFVTWYSALVGLVARVSPDVLLEMRELGELALTYFTSVRLDAEVDPGVLREVGAVRKRFSTTRTFIRLWLSQMDLCVELKVRLGVKSL